MKQLSQITDKDALEVANLLGGASHLSEQGRIFQCKEIIATNKLYNTQTNIPGIGWYRAFAYLKSQGYKIGEEECSWPDPLILLKGFEKVISVVHKYREYDGQTSVGNHVENEIREILASYRSGTSVKGEKQGEKWTAKDVKNFISWCGHLAWYDNESQLWNTWDESLGPFRYTTEEMMNEYIDCDMDSEKFENKHAAE